MEPVIDDTREFGIFDKCYFVNVVLLVASHQQILVQVLKIWGELFHNKLSVNTCIIVFNMNEIIIVDGLVILILVSNSIKLTLVHGYPPTTHLWILIHILITSHWKFLNKSRPLIK